MTYIYIYIFIKYLYISLFCAVNGNWGAFGPYGACSKSCGGGTQTRHRACNNPAPAHGGRACPGSSSNFRACNTHHCPGNCPI